MCRPSLKISVQFWFAFKVITGTKPFASGPICCSIFTLVLVGIISMCDCFYELLCNIKPTQNIVK